MIANDFTDLESFTEKELSSQSFLNKSQINKGHYKKVINSKKISNIIEEIYGRSLFSCNDALCLAEGIYEDYSLSCGRAWSSKPNHDRLKDIIYNYNQSQLYPHTLNQDYRDQVRDESFKQFYGIFSKILKIFCNNAKANSKNGWEHLYPYHSLRQEDYKDSRFKKEYEKFETAFNRQNVYELMKMSQEWKGFTSLDHTLGVYNLCMFIGKQMKNLGFPVDLAILSGASIGHDIGKYGCVGEELKRIAYYHYFYTKDWYDRNGLFALSHYATNHSTWDLEELRLPNEEIILIYSDFRVKNRVYPDGTSAMDIYSNKESFDVIRDKLDNLDEAKLDRYRKVYRKLEDLERMFITLGINTDIKQGIKQEDLGQKRSMFNALCIVNGNVNSDFISILPNSEIINACKTLTVAHNIFVMDKIRDTYSLKRLFEDARHEKTKSDLRIYLSIIEAYSDFLTLEQRELCINFLFGLLDHPDDDIRYHSSDTIGKFVAEMREAYTRYLPPDKTHMVIDKSDEYLDMIFSLLDSIEQSDPEGYLTERKLYNVTIAIRRLLKTTLKDKRAEIENKIMDRVLKRANNRRSLPLLYLTEIISDAGRNISDATIIKAGEMLFNNLFHNDHRIRLMALRALLNLSIRKIWDDFHKLNRDKIISGLKNIISNTKCPTELYMVSKLLKTTDKSFSKELPCDMLSKVDSTLENVDIRPIFLKNLKTSTPWIEKKINCIMLVEIAEILKISDPDSSLIIDIAIHLGNVLKVSQYEGTRFQAGSSLLELSRMLNHTQLNELSIELLRTLEQESLGFTHYIPRVLGQIVAKLPADEFLEVYDDIKQKIKTGSPSLKELYLKTLSIILSHIKDDIHEENSRDIKMLGLLTGALCDTDRYTKQKAHYIIGSRIFGSKFLTPYQKRDILAVSLKKILSLISNTPNDYIDLFYSASLLNNIYIFISNFEFEHNTLKLSKDNKVAFFPGTFDPCSLSHLEIIKCCQKDGFDVFIQVDEFSWRKRTLPPAIRKNIIRLSTSHLLNTFIYPEIPPINIANTHDLQRLIETFKGRNIFMVAGADVVANATAYQSGKESLLKSLDHYIVYRKDTRGKSIHRQKPFKKAIKTFTGKVIIKELNDVFNHINSTKIRNLVDSDDPIDHMVDARSAMYIRDNNLYIKQPEQKQSIEFWDFKIETIDIANDLKSIRGIPQKIQDFFVSKKRRYYSERYDLTENLIKRDAKLFIIKRSKQENDFIAVIIYFDLRDQGIFGIIKDPVISKFQRSNTFGKIAFIDSAYIHKDFQIFAKSRFHLYLIKEGYLFSLQELDLSLLRENSDLGKAERLEKHYTKLTGYNQIPHEWRQNNKTLSLMIADLRKPVLFINDLEDVLKAPFNSHPAIKSRLKKNRESNLNILSKINRESVIISLNYKDIVFNLMEKISLINRQEKNCPYLCILFGNILGKYIVPDTITKALHAERVVNKQGKLVGFTHSKYYYSIPIQLKTIKAFGRKTIMTDIVVHSARRILNIKKAAGEVGVEIKKVVSGLISGLAKEIMDANNIESDSLFYVPRLHSWYEEHNFYPYIGGDSILDYIDIDEPFNRAMSYVLPFCPYEQQYNTSLNDRLVFSQNSLLNAHSLFSDIENIYLETKKKNLILNNMQEIVESPRLPVYNPLFLPDREEMVTELILKDIETLKRFYPIA